jgi:hypothetical protein
MDHTGWSPEELGERLAFGRRTLDQLVQYIRDPEETKVREVMRRWKFDPMLIE